MRIGPKTHIRYLHQWKEDANPWEVKIIFNEKEQDYTVICDSYPCKEGQKGNIAEVATALSKIYFSGPIGKPKHYVVMEGNCFMDVAHSKKEAVEKMKSCAESIKDNIKKELKKTYVDSMNEPFRELTILSSSEHGVPLDSTVFIEDMTLSGGKLYSCLRTLRDYGMAEIRDNAAYLSKEAKEAFDIPEPDCKVINGGNVVNLYEKDDKFLLTYRSAEGLEVERFWLEKSEKEIQYGDYPDRKETVYVIKVFSDKPLPCRIIFDDTKDLPRDKQFYGDWSFSCCWPPPS